MVADFVAQIVASAGVSAALSGLLLWVTKSWISERLQQSIRNEYNQKLETHKAQLKAQADVELEKLHSQLSISAAERQILFSHLHEQRAQVVAETYALLKSLYSALANYVKVFELAGETPREQRKQEAAEAHQAFRQYYSTKLIFIPKAVATKLENIDFELVKTFNEFVFGVEMKIKVGADGYDKWMKIFERVNGEVKVALAELEDEFRRLIGDES